MPPVRRPAISALHGAHARARARSCLRVLSGIHYQTSIHFVNFGIMGEQYQYDAMLADIERAPASSVSSSVLPFVHVMACA